MIAQTFDEAFTQVKTLAERFQKDEKEYLKTTYQEAEVRQHFLDKFFVALGWDVYHQEQSNPYEREVKIEKSVMVGGRGKRADYAFYTAPNFSQARFMAEAKKPSRQLENAQDCFQAIRYGWNSNTPISVLTDFEQFLMLDSRYKPTIETAVDRILKKFHYAEYADEEKFREIYFLFSREAVGNNAIESYAQTLRKSRGARQGKLFQTAQIQPVGDTFLTELDEHREELARAFKRRNAELDGDALTEITQRTLDRLVFLRFLEDKLVEPSEIIDNLGTKSGSAWRDFAAEMPRLNKIYNGIIFKPHRILDSPTFAPDERAFEATRDWLAHRNSAYDFNTIPIHILGSIYERFLGKTIVTTDKQAKVEEKPEVRKAGGVYYTPEYIVRYIVENTIGKLLFRVPALAGSSPPPKKPAKAGTQNARTQNATPEEIARMRFADIACGSGSFLLGVFDYLIAYHVRYYNGNKTRREKAIKDGLCRETADGILQLSISHKRDILENNIYGVDLDAQAVEVAQLSLYLKLLEEETTATKQQFLAGFREQLLPSLDKNIVHGNSLVDEDIDFGLFDHKDLKRLNPMNFERTFKEVFDKGGFDAIVGNPPYVRQELFTDKKPYFQTHYTTYHGVADLYVYFFERYTNLLKDGGEFGIIVANKWLRANYGEPLRRWLKKLEIVEIIDFGDLPVFQGATTYPCVVRVRKQEAKANFNVTEIETLDFTQKSLLEYVAENQFSVGQNELEDKGWSLTGESVQNLLNKLRGKGVPLGEYVSGKIYRGVLTGLNEAFVIDAATKARLIAEDIRSAELIKPFLAGRDIKRYETPQAEKFLILMPKGWTGKQFAKEFADLMVAVDSKTKIYKGTPEEDSIREKIIASGKHNHAHPEKAEEWLRQNFPAVFKHLKPFAEAAEKRCDKGDFWWELRACDYYDEFEKPKIIYPNICKQPEFTFEQDSTYTNQKCFIISVEDKYLLAILNSSVSFFLFRQLLPKLRGDFYEPSYIYFKTFPIRTIDFSNPTEKAAHDKIVELVDKMLDGKRQLADALTDADKRFYERLCASLDAQIDDEVYKLYDIKTDERKIIEG